MIKVTPLEISGQVYHNGHPWFLACTVSGGAVDWSQDNLENSPEDIRTEAERQLLEMVTIARVGHVVVDVSDEYRLLDSFWQIEEFVSVKNGEFYSVSVRCSNYQKERVFSLIELRLATHRESQIYIVP